MSCEENLKRIEDKLDTINLKLDVIIQGNEKLDNHIDFVDSVYSTLKTPLDYVSKKFGGNTLEDKKE